MLLIPFNNFWLYPLLEKCGFELNPLRKMSIGMFIASVAFVAVALIQYWIDASAAEVTENKVSVLWQILPYLLMTQAEVMVSITGLEFAYTQAPTKMKSTIMGFWLLLVTIGDLLVVFVTRMKFAPEKGFWIFHISLDIWTLYW